MNDLTAFSNYGNDLLGELGTLELKDFFNAVNITEDMELWFGKFKKNPKLSASNFRNFDNSLQFHYNQLIGQGNQILDLISSSDFE